MKTEIIHNIQTLRYSCIYGILFDDENSLMYESILQHLNAIQKHVQ